MDSLKRLESLRKRKQDYVLKPIFGDFVNDATNEVLFEISATLISAKCIQYSVKNNIMEHSQITCHKAEKLFDTVYKSDLKVIDIFLNEVKNYMPHVYRKIEQENKSILFKNYFSKLLFFCFVSSLVLLTNEFPDIISGRQNVYEEGKLTV
jgi:hypothetical protein